MRAGCEDAREALGVYVLGVIDPAERALADQHLAVCRECRDELAELAGLPALLAKMTPGEAARASSASPHRGRHRPRAGVGQARPGPGRASTITGSPVGDQLSLPTAAPGQRANEI